MEQSERKDLENLLQAQGKEFAEFRSINDRRLRNLESAFHKLVKKAPRPGIDVLSRNHGNNFKG